MKDWLKQQLIGDGAVDGPVQEALLDLFWMMPWWFPHLVLATAGLWLLFIWLARLGKSSGNQGAAARSAPTVTRKPTRKRERLRMVA